MLIDGNSLTYRAFHALPQDLATASGQATNAVLGFTSMLINLVRDHKPDGVVVAFDRPEPTFRHKQLETYKANRSETPDILRQQMGIVREVLDVLGIHQIDQIGIEADDILATLATQGDSAGLDVLIVTGDRDSFQLVADPRVKVVYNKRGVSDYAIYDEEGILERTGVRPSQYVQYAAMRGDPSDNLPGVPGVGEKTAAKLINSWGGIEGIYDNLDSLTPKLRENLANHEPEVKINTAIMELVRDVDLGVKVEDLVGMPSFDVAEAKKLFDFLEFRNLFDRLAEAFDLGVADDTSYEYVDPEIVNGADDPCLLSEIRKSDVVVGVGSHWSEAGGLEGIAFSTGPDSPAIWVGAADLANPVVGDAVAVVVDGSGPSILGHDVKGLIRALLGYGIDLAGLKLDTALAAYLLDPSRGNYDVGHLLATYTNWRLPTDDDAPDGQLDFGENKIEPSRRAARQALAAHLVGEPLVEALVKDGLSSLNSEIEVPLVRVLARMEHVGIGVDRQGLEMLSASMTAEAESLATLIHQDAGEEFNVNSTKKLREILFEKLGLTPKKKTKTGFSTDQATLEKLRGDHPIIEHLLRYREVEKLRSTYGSSLLAAVGPDDRIHATFNQMVARTGRLSSEHPNLHNIPVRTEMGRAFRTAFVPAAGHTLLVADYNQIELRCIAHLCDDPGLVGAFVAGTDIHRATAARVFGVDPQDVDYEQRSRAKMVSYGLAYGMEAYGLGQRLGVPTREAQEILDAYFVGFPSVKQYMDSTVIEARNRGYTETLFGRRRSIPELRSDNPRIRQAGERQAMNAGIQGLAADIFKVALVRLDQRLERDRLAARIVLQVHDEILVEAHPDDVEAATQAIVEEMTGAFELNVPLEINLGSGDTWGASKT